MEKEIEIRENIITTTTRSTRCFVDRVGERVTNVSLLLLFTGHSNTMAGSPRAPAQCPKSAQKRKRQIKICNEILGADISKNCFLTFARARDGDRDRAPGSRLLPAKSEVV